LADLLADLVTEFMATSGDTIAEYKSSAQMGDARLRLPGTIPSVPGPQGRYRTLQVLPGQVAVHSPL